MKRPAALLQHPLTRGLPLDDPRTTALRRRIVREKGFLFEVYREWGAAIAAALPAGPGVVVELGSGGGILPDFIPGVLTSDLFVLPELDVVATGEALPFAEASVAAVVMQNVLHHVRDVRAMLRDTARVTRGGGRLVMIEPWNTPWSRFVCRYLHHEPFEPAARDWALPPGGGQLSAANGALPWILFARDRKRFDAEFPEWRVRSVVPFMPLAYLLAGGVSSRLGLPRRAYAIVRRLEAMVPVSLAAMFALIVLERTGDDRRPVRTP